MRGTSYIVMALMAILSITFVGCGGKRVTRTSVDKTIDLSGRWNDSDSRYTSETMIKQMLDRPWIDDYMSEHKSRPVVIISRVVNKSSEHINSDTFIKDLRAAMINSGRVKVVAGGGEREAVREERKDQAVHSSEESAKAPGQETGADFMLRGTINTITDSAGDEKVIYYQIDLELINMGDNSIAWTGTKKIKKFIERDSVRY